MLVRFSLVVILGSPVAPAISLALSSIAPTSQLKASERPFGLVFEDISSFWGIILSFCFWPQCN
jgi:hypothetical protein